MEFFRGILFAWKHEYLSAARYLYKHLVERKQINLDKVKEMGNKISAYELKNILFPEVKPKNIWDDVCFFEGSKNFKFPFVLQGNAKEAFIFWLLLKISNNLDLVHYDNVQY